MEASEIESSMVLENEAVDISNSETTTSEDLQAREKLRDLQSTKDWLNQQLTEHRTNLCAAEKEQDASHMSEDADQEKILERIVKLQKEVSEVSLNNSIRELICSRLSEVRMLIKLVFPPSSKVKSELASTDKIERDRQKVISLIEEQTRLCTEAMTQHRVIQGIQPNIDKFMKESLDLKKDSRELLFELQNIRNEHENHTEISRRNARVANAQKDLEHVTAKVQILRCVFQRLIIGSGIDWAEDSKLCEIMINLGRPLQDLLHQT